MRDEQERMERLFFAIHEAIPRQGPGCREATLRAFGLCPGLPAEPRILDVGCGAGAQTLSLAEASGGVVTAVDNHGPFLGALLHGAATSGLAERVRPVAADMAALPFSPASFDLIWSEGAVYIMGFEAALAMFRELLRPGGCVAVTELAFTSDRPDRECRDYWQAAYPGVRDVAGLEAAAKRAGYQVLGLFWLPDAAWTEDYYGPLAQCLAGLSRAYPEDAAVSGVAEAIGGEMALFDRHHHDYGYAFLVLRLPAA